MWEKQRNLLIALGVFAGLAVLLIGWFVTRPVHYGSPTARQWDQLRTATASITFANAALARCNYDRLSDDIDPATAEAELREFTNRYDLSEAQKQILSTGSNASTSLSLSLTEGGVSGEMCFNAQQLINGVVKKIRSGELAQG